jgi:hypothetical protein
VRSVHERPDSLEADVQSDNQHRHGDERLCAPFHAFGGVRIASLSPEPPNEDGRCGRIEQRVQREPGKGETVRGR